MCRVEEIHARRSAGLVHVATCLTVSSAAKLHASEIQGRDIGVVNSFQIGLRSHIEGRILAPPVKLSA